MKGFVMMGLGFESLLRHHAFWHLGHGISSLGNQRGNTRYFMASRRP